MSTSSGVMIHWTRGGTCQRWRKLMKTLLQPRFLMSSAPFLPCWLTGYDFKPLCDVANMPPETSVDVKAAPWIPWAGAKNRIQMDSLNGFHSWQTSSCKKTCFKIKKGLGCHASDLDSSKDTFELWIVDRLHHWLHWCLYPPGISTWICWMHGLKTHHL